MYIYIYTQRPQKSPKLRILWAQKGPGSPRKLPRALKRLQDDLKTTPKMGFYNFWGQFEGRQRVSGVAGGLSGLILRPRSRFLRSQTLFWGSGALNWSFQGRRRNYFDSTQLPFGLRGDFLEQFQGRRALFGVAGGCFGVVLEPPIAFWGSGSLLGSFWGPLPWLQPRSCL